MKKLVTAIAVFVTVAACAGCSGSALSPTPGPDPASGEHLLSSGDLDSDGKDDAVFGVPKSPTVTTYTSIRAVASTGTTLLAMPDDEFAGAVIVQPVGAPAPIIIVSRLVKGQAQFGGFFPLGSITSWKGYSWHEHRI